MIVVSNTSPLTNLAAIGQFELLRHLYGRIVIADGVWEELHAFGQAWPGSAETAADWVTRQPVESHQALVEALRRDLDRGEAETIALAVELGADLVLLDEREGRRAAARLGLPVAGVLGVLLEAKQRGLLSAVQPHLQALRETAGFFLSDGVINLALELAGER